MPKFADYAANLLPATSREAPDRVVWTTGMEASFNKLRECLCNHVSLCVPVPGESFILYTDFQRRSLHVLRNNIETPVAFYSRMLRGPVVRYSASEREALALVAALNHFEVMTYGQRVTVRTNHKPNLAMVDGHSRSDLNP